MSSVTFENVSFSYVGQTKPVLEDVHLNISQHQTVGLVGRNGAGKSTLLRLLMGELRPDVGTIHAPDFIAFVSDSECIREDVSTVEAAMLPDRLAPLYDEMIRVEDADPARFAKLTIEFSELDGFSFLATATANVSELFSPDLLTASPGTLSGGERRLLALARSLALHSELVVWDEPTNSLDSHHRRRLESWLAGLDHTLIIATHDRSLLSDVDGIVEVERASVSYFSGNYDVYSREKRTALERDIAKTEQLDKEIAVFEKQARRYDTWGDRKEKEKRGAMDKGFIGARAAKLKKRGKHAQNRMLSSAEELRKTKPYIAREYRLHLPSANRTSGSVCHKTIDVFAGGDRSAPYLTSVDVVLNYGDRIGVVGRNGCGKSSFIVSLFEALRETGRNVAAMWQLASRSVSVVDRFDDEQQQWALDTLGAMHLDGERFESATSELSDGQFQKVRFLEAIAKQPDILLLDEPTNHLDLPTIEMLEASLNEWNGTLVVVSHDDTFLRNVTETRWEIPFATRRNSRGKETSESD